MRIPRFLRASVFLLVAASFAPAQTCPGGSGETFWKNDSLPDNPVNPTGISIIPGVCEGEAIATYFQMPGGMPAQTLTQVSVGFGHSAGGAGFDATLNVEIYEGAVTYNPDGTAVLGTKIFDLNADFSQSMQVTSTAINLFDMTPYNVEVSDDFVVAFRMNFNVAFPGCPSGGAAANFFTDNAGAGQCLPGVNLLDELTSGWVDPATWGPLPPFLVLCPSFYAGNWVIRACTEDVPGATGTWTDLGGGTVGSNGAPTLVGSGPLTAGSVAQLNLTQAPPNALMLAWLSLSSLPINVLGGTVYATPPINQIFLFSNILGSLQVSTFWPAGAPPGTEVFFQFIIDDAPTFHGLTLTNCVKATTP